MFSVDLKTDSKLLRVLGRVNKPFSILQKITIINKRENANENTNKGGEINGETSDKTKKRGRLFYFFYFFGGRGEKGN